MVEHIKLEKILYYFYASAVVVLIIGVYFFYTDMYSVYAAQEVTIDNGTSYQLELLPKNADKFDYNNYVFKVKNKDVVSINEHGEIKSLKEGSTVVSIRYKHSLGKEKVKINVVDLKVKDLEIEDDFCVNVNDTKKINVKVNEQDNIGAKLFYIIKDERIAKVDDYGNITGVKEGTTYITVTSNNGVSKSVKVIVEANDINIEEINIEENELNLKVGEKQTLSVYLVPNSASRKKLKWSTSNKNVAVVDSNGVVTAKKAGYAIISAKAGSINSQVTVYVSEEESIMLSRYNVEMKVGSTFKISSNIPVKYTSSDNSVVTIDETGNMKALKVGKVTISASANNKKNTCIVVVSDSNTTETHEVKSIDVKDNNITLLEGDSKKLSVNVYPSNAENKNVLFSSTNSSVATVDSEGIITALKSGKTKIVITSESNKSVKYEVLVTVKARVIEVSSISLNASGKTLVEGDTYQLSVTYVPKDATNKSVTWSSSDSSIATVNSSGLVTAIKEGKTTIKAITSNNKTASVTITVNEKIFDVTGLSITSSITSMYVGDSVTLSTSVNPRNATNKKVIWSSSDSSVASVDEYGVVTAKKSGSVKITATSASNSSVSDSIVIAVNVKNIPVKKLTSEKSSYTLKYNKSYQWKVTVSPSDATNKQVIYSSSDKSIATVDSNGKITAKSVKGTVTITAKAKENNSIKTTIEITVIPDPLVVAANYKKVNYSNFKWRYYFTQKGPINEYYDKSLPYAIYAPEDVSDLKGVSLPLIIWLHGAGEIECNNFTYVGFPKVIREWTLEPIPAIIIAPHTGNQWKTDKEFEMVKASILYAKDAYNIDMDNVVLMGHSMGGRGSVFLSYGMYKKFSKNYFSTIVTLSSNVYQAYPSDNATDGYNFFSKIRMRGYGESETNGFYDWLNKDYFYLKNVSHGNIPKEALNKDDNKDGVSDLVNWMFNLDGKSN